MQIKNTQNVNLILERLKLYLRLSTDTQLAAALGIKTNTLANWKNRGSVDYSAVFTLCEKSFLDLNYIIYGDINSSLKSVPNSESGNNDKITPNITPKGKKAGSFPALNTPKVISIDSTTKEENTLFVTAKAAAGYLNGYADPEFREELQVVNLPGLKGQTHRAFEIKGNSMLPTHHSGSIAIGRYVESFNDIRDRRIYIVVTKTEGIVLKRVLNRIKDDNKLILLSDNDNKREYPTYSISPEDVLELWYWRASIIRESPEPGTVYTRINDLEGRLALIETLLKSK